MIGRVILLFGAGIFLCYIADAQQAVPVTRERHHRIILENDYIRVLDGRVAAGDSCPVLRQRGLRYQWRKPGVTAYYWDVPRGQHYRLPASSCTGFLIGVAGTYPFRFYPPKTAIKIDGHARKATRYIFMQIP